MGSMRVLLIALLLIQASMVIAGAIYIEGGDNSMPADGSPVILAATSPTDSTPTLSGLPGQGFAFPAFQLPAIPAYDDLLSGIAIGHIVPPMQPGYWDNITDFKTNMPIIEPIQLFK